MQTEMAKYQPIKRQQSKAVNHTPTASNEKITANNLK